MKRELEFASHPANLSAVRGFVRDFIEPVPLSASEADLIVLGIDEACTNIIRHAYKHEERHPIVLACERLENRLEFRLRDFGAHGDPNSLQGRPLDMIQPGGLGLHLIRKGFDQVDYNLKREGTELVLVKQFKVAAGNSDDNQPASHDHSTEAESGV
jgi:anti-sigma regulatory factor (Ser/Thr protein kinase)